MNKISINDNWKVYRDKDAFSLVYSVPEDAVTVNLPYDAMFHEKQDPNSAGQGRMSFFDGGVYHYYKDLFIPENLKGQRLLLYFEGIFSRSFVYLNGSLVGSGDFGYVGFHCDISDYADYGRNNKLLVIAKTEALSSRWYSGAGICRYAWMLTGDRIHIKEQSLRVSLKNRHDDGIDIELSLELNNISQLAENIQLVLSVSDDVEKIKRSYPIKIKGRSSYAFTKQFWFEGAELWSEDNPKLYTVKAEVFIDGQLVDSDSEKIGFRELKWNASKGLTVNGKTVKLRGACIHHDDGILGGVSLFDYEYRRVKRLKEAGFNAVRSAHNHASPELLSACDKLGVYVLDEVCDMWTKQKGYGDYGQYFEYSRNKTMDTMIADDFNRACVVGYSTGNEISDICTDKGIETAHEMYMYFHEKDPSRFVTNGINGAFAAGDGLAEIAADLTGRDPQEFMNGDVNQFMGLMATRMPDIVKHPVVGGILERLDSSMDIAGYNYMTARYAPDSQTYPDRLMLGTETYPKQIAENWREIRAHSACVGDFTWTGWDYMGELGPQFPAWGNTAGDIDSFGCRRPESYYREIVFGLRKEPYICVRPPESFGKPRMFGPWKFTDAVESWSFGDKRFGDDNTEKLLTVEVYSADNEAELFLNGTSLGRKVLTDCFALFDVKYIPDELKVKTYKDGVLSSEQSLVSSGEASAVEVTAETVEPSREGLCFANIRIVDDRGRTVLYPGRQLHIECEGMELIAFASLAENHDCGFAHDTISMSGEGALAILKKTAEYGKVTISSDGLISGEAEF